MTFVLYQHDPAHSFGSIDGSGTTVTLSRTYICSECRKEFGSDSELTDHMNRAHPITHPHLLIAGTRIPAEWTVRKHQAATVVAVNSDSIALSFDGSSDKRCTTAAVAEILASEDEGVLEITVGNRGAESRYRVILRVPAEAELEAIHERFTARLARNDATVSDVRRFSEEVRGGQAAIDYASGLADYVYGVLAKDGAGGTSLLFLDHRKKFARAAAVLSEFENTFARAICCCVRFNLNDFLGPWTPTGVSTLDLGFSHFRRLARVEGSARHSARTLRQSGRAGVALCPVDSATERLLRLVENHGRLDSDDLLRQGMSDEDRAKTTVLMAETALKRKPDQAIGFLLQLQHDPIFGNWAAKAIASGTI